jgi:hypothetical protein
MLDGWPRGGGEEVLQSRTNGWRDFRIRVALPQEVNAAELAECARDNDSADSA